MTLEIPANRDRFKPSYWEGYDLLSGEGVLPGSRRWYLGKKEYDRAASWLKPALSEVAAGNHTDVRYQSGIDFNPDAVQIPDGSMVIVDSEGVTSRPMRVDLMQGSPPISEPFVDYWLKNQPNTGNLGVEAHVDATDSLWYSRWLSWGIMTTAPVYDYSTSPATVEHRRLIQPFSFSNAALDKSGKVKNWPWTGQKFWYPTVLLPCEVGRAKIVGISPEDNQPEEINRVRCIELVYLAAGKRGGAKRNSVLRSILSRAISPNPTTS